jgi:hypothetical protein
MAEVAIGKPSSFTTTGGSNLSFRFFVINVDPGNDLRAGWFSPVLYPGSFRYPNSVAVNLTLLYDTTGTGAPDPLPITIAGT